MLSVIIQTTIVCIKWSQHRATAAAFGVAKSIRLILSFNSILGWGWCHPVRTGRLNCLWNLILPRPGWRLLPPLLRWHWHCQWRMRGHWRLILNRNRLDELLPRLAADCRVNYQTVCVDDMPRTLRPRRDVSTAPILSWVSGSLTFAAFISYFCCWLSVLCCRISDFCCWISFFWVANSPSTWCSRLSSPDLRSSVASATVLLLVSSAHHDWPPRDVQYDQQQVTLQRHQTGLLGSPYGLTYYGKVESSAALPR